MNIVAIDPSLISTALLVSNGNGYKIFNYCRESKAYGKNGMTKWFKMAEEYVTYRFIKFREYDSYSEGELVKLKDYDAISDTILKDILDNIDHSKPTRVGIEGYSFSSSGDIIDLVTFSTLLRKKLWDQLTKDIIVLSPSTLKLESCKMSYPPIFKEIGGKNKRTEIVWKNTLGVSGGKFDKKDIFESIVDNVNLTDEWANHCRSARSEIIGIKTIPKPYEDVNDSFIIFNYLSNLNNSIL